MTSEKIKEVALRHFAQYGYEGASLADISTEVGIKKQSIYNHFKHKDELFLSVFRDVLEREVLFVNDYLKSDGLLSIQKILYNFLLNYKERYEEEEDTKFFLRMAFFPPSHLQQEVKDDGVYYLERMNQLLVTLFKIAVETGEIDPHVSIEWASTAFTAIMDGMFVELLYDNMDRALQRIEASWYFYWRGIIIR